MKMKKMKILLIAVTVIALLLQVNICYAVSQAQIIQEKAKTLYEIMGYSDVTMHGKYLMDIGYDIMEKGYEDDGKRITSYNFTMDDMYSYVYDNNWNFKNITDEDEYKYYEKNRRMQIIQELKNELNTFRTDSRYEDDYLTSQAGYDGLYMICDVILNRYQTLKETYGNVQTEQPPDGETITKDEPDKFGEIRNWIYVMTGRQISEYDLLTSTYWYQRRWIGKF